jgi:hypothetical protein
MKILDVFVVMPNHVHGIIIINKTNGSADTTSATGNTDVETQNTDVETQNFASLLRIIRKEHYLLNQSRDIRLISQPKNGISYTMDLAIFGRTLISILISQSENRISYTINYNFLCN